MIAVLRKTMGWDVQSIVEEYTGYAQPKAREVDITYIQSLGPVWHASFERNLAVIWPNDAPDDVQPNTEELLGSEN